MISTPSRVRHRTGPHAPWLALFSLMLCATAAAAERPEAPPYLAITGAKVVTGTGEVLDSATVVVENGLITAVGAGVSPPAVARVIDASGLVVYPGLIDGLSSVGLPKKAAPGRGGAGRGGPPRGGTQPQVSVGPEDRPGTTPQKRFAEKLDASADAVETWRAGGFTNAVVADGEGIFPGQATFSNLAGERAREMVLRPAVALPVHFDGGGYRGFPGSLMGQIAYARQVFLDADHYSRAWRSYESSPRGQERPSFDATLEAVAEARARGLALVLPGVTAPEIGRALDLAAELGLGNVVVAGAHQGYDAVDRLKAAGASVLVNVDWPKRSEDADPDQEDSLRELRLRDRAPSTPKALYDAGIPFAFTSGEVGSPADMLAAVKKAVDAGLPADAAIRALTLGAAELYGMDDRLGSVEAGKMANLMLTEGELFGEKTRVRHVFVDGHLYSNPPEPEKGAEGDGDGSKKGRKGKRPGGAELGNAELVEAFGDGAFLDEACAEGAYHHGAFDDGHGHSHDHEHPRAQLEEQR